MPTSRSSSETNSKATRQPTEIESSTIAAPESHPITTPPCPSISIQMRTVTATETLKKTITKTVAKTTTITETAAMSIGKEITSITPIAHETIMKTEFLSTLGTSMLTRTEYIPSYIKAIMTTYTGQSILPSVSMVNVDVVGLGLSGLT